MRKNIVHTMILGVCMFVFSSMPTETVVATGISSKNITDVCRIHHTYLPVLANQSYSLSEEIEPNNRRVEANGPVISGRKYFGFANDEWDIYKLKLLEVGSINTKLMNHVGNDIKLLLYHESDTKSAVAYDESEPFQFDYNGYEGEGAEIGTYYVAIQNKSGFNDSIPYSLTVTYPQPDAEPTVPQAQLCDPFQVFATDAELGFQTFQMHVANITDNATYNLSLIPRNWRISDDLGNVYSFETRSDVEPNMNSLLPVINVPPETFDTLILDIVLDKRINRNATFLEFEVEGITLTQGNKSSQPHEPIKWRHYLPDELKLTPRKIEITGGLLLHHHCASPCTPQNAEENFTINPVVLYLDQEKPSDSFTIGMCLDSGAGGATWGDLSVIAERIPYTNDVTVEVTAALYDRDFDLFNNPNCGSNKYKGDSKSYPTKSFILEQGGKLVGFPKLAHSEDYFNLSTIRIENLD